MGIYNRILSLAQLNIPMLAKWNLLLKSIKEQKVCKHLRMLKMVVDLNIEGHCHGRAITD